MRLDDLTQVGMAASEKTVGPACDVEMLDPAVAVMGEHETGVPAGISIADPHGVDNGDRIVRAQLAEPPGGRKPAGARAEHRPVGGDRGCDPPRRGGRRQGFVPAVAHPVIRQLARGVDRFHASTLRISSVGSRIIGARNGVKGRPVNW